MALTDDLISSWRFNGDWMDQIGSNHGTPSGALIDASVKHLGSGSGLYDGLNDLTNYGNGASFNVANISFSFWVRITAIGTVQYIISKRGSTSDLWYALITATERLQFGLWTPSGLITATSGASAISINTWHNVICTYDGANMRLYIDEVLKAKSAQTGDALVSVADVITGAYYNTTFPLAGNIDQTDIWGRSLTFTADTIGVAGGGEIAELYNGGAGIELESANGALFFFNEE